MLIDNVFALLWDGVLHNVVTDSFGATFFKKKHIKNLQSVYSYSFYISLLIMYFFFLLHN